MTQCTQTTHPQKLTMLCSTCNNIGVCAICGIDMSHNVPKERLHEHLIKCMQGAGVGPLCLCNKPKSVKKTKPSKTTVPKTTHCTVCNKVVFCEDCLIDMVNHVSKEKLLHHAKLCSNKDDQLCMCKKASFKKVDKN